MAPTFRSSRSGRQLVDNTVNRNRSGHIDHDVFEGLPVRRWSRQNHTVSQDPKMDIPDNNDRDPGSDQPLLPELPMPKDSHLLAPHSRALLRAARAGYIYLRPAKKEAEEDVQEAPAVEETAPATMKIERSFTARKWTQVPKHLEPVSEDEFLAKRRQGLPSMYGAAGTVNAATAAVASTSEPMRKAKIQKVDPITGNVAIYDAWIPEGQKLEGEIKEDGEQHTTVAKVVPVPGAIIDGVGVANAGTEVGLSPSKRKGPIPPKRKAKGIGGIGRKKVQFASGEEHGPSALQGMENAYDRMVIDGEQYEDDEEDEDGEEQDEGTRTEEEIALDNTASGDTLPDSTAISATEENAPPAFEPSTGNMILDDEPRRPPIEALSPVSPILEPTPAPPEISYKSSLEQLQSGEGFQSEAFGSLVPAATAVGSSITAVKDEVPENVDDAANPMLDPVAPEAPFLTSQPAADGMAMEGVEPTNTNLPGLDAPGFAPAPEKVEIVDVVSQGETVEKVEPKQNDAFDQTPGPTTVEEAISEPATSERVDEEATRNASERGDISEKLEASLGNEKVKPDERPAEVTVPAKADQASFTASAEPPAEPSVAESLPEAVSNAVGISTEAPAEVPVSERESAAEPVIAEDVESEATEKVAEPDLQPDAEGGVGLNSTHPNVKDAQTEGGDQKPKDE